MPAPNVSPHIAGDTAWLTPRQREMVALAGELGRDRFAPRAALHDREASFPADNYRDLRDSGLLALCIPQETGGMGGDYTAFMLVAAEIGRHCGATALSYTMHVGATLWAGQVADALEMSAAQRADHESHRAAMRERIVAHGWVYAQPFSEGGAASAGKAPWGTRARRVEGGYVVNGKKLFATLAGAADCYGVLCTLDTPEATRRDTLFLAVPARAPGLSVCGDWDPLGMRATVSRDLQLNEVFVPHQGKRSANPSFISPLKLRTSGLRNQRTRRGGHGSTADGTVPGASGGVSCLWPEGAGMGRGQRGASGNAAKLVRTCAALAGAARRRQP